MTSRHGLGQGGMGVVFRARHGNPGTPWAVKLLIARPGLSPETDARRYEAVRGRTRVALSHYEVQVLRMLVERRDEVVSRNEILNEVWGIDALPTDRTVDNYIVKLRQKLERDPRRPRHILTVHGAGCKFVGA